MSERFKELVLKTSDSEMDRGFESHPLRHFAQIAQSVEQRTENPRVGGSIPPLGTNWKDFFICYDREIFL